jgi:hypothetical protein
VVRKQRGRHRHGRRYATNCRDAGSGRKQARGNMARDRLHRIQPVSVETPGSVSAFVDEVVPLLWRRGIYRQDYTTRTFRGNLISERGGYSAAAANAVATLVPCRSWRTRREQRWRATRSRRSRTRATVHPKQGAPHPTMGARGHFWSASRSGSEWKGTYRHQVSRCHFDTGPQPGKAASCVERLD